RRSSSARLPSPIAPARVAPARQAAKTYPCTSHVAIGPRAGDPSAWKTASSESFQPCAAARQGSATDTRRTRRRRGRRTSRSRAGPPRCAARSTRCRPGPRCAGVSDGQEHEERRCVNAAVVALVRRLLELGHLAVAGLVQHLARLGVLLGNDLG